MSLLDFLPRSESEIASVLREGCLSWLMGYILKSIEHESLKASVQKKHGLIFLAQSKLIAFIWLLVLAGLNLLIQVESSPSDDGFCMFLLPSARSFPEFGTTPLVRTPPTGKSDAASEMLCPVP